MSKLFGLLSPFPNVAPMATVWQRGEILGLPGAFEERGLWVGHGLTLSAVNGDEGEVVGDIFYGITGLLVGDKDYRGCFLRQALERYGNNLLFRGTLKDPAIRPQILGVAAPD